MRWARGVGFLHLSRDAPNVGILTLINPVGLLDTAPQLPWQTTLRATPGHPKRSFANGVRNTEAFWGSSGGPGCSERKLPPQQRTMVKAYNVCNANNEPVLNCLNSRSVSPSSPHNCRTSKTKVFKSHLKS